jgi:hypothetical protein
MVTESPPAAPPTPVPDPAAEAAAAARRDAVAKAEARFASSGAALAAAQVRLSEAKRRVENFGKDDPATAGAQATTAAVAAIAAERDRLAKAAARPPTPAQVREGNAAMVAFVEMDPERARVAASALEWLKADFVGRRETAGATDWKSLNFFGSGFDRATQAILAKASAAPKPAVPPELTKDVETAEKAVNAARDAVAAAERDLAAAKKAAVGK